MKKRILIFGAGVIGSTYGGLMALTGHELASSKGFELNELRKLL